MSGDPTDDEPPDGVEEETEPSDSRTADADHEDAETESESESEASSAAPETDGETAEEMEAADTENEPAGESAEPADDADTERESDWEFPEEREDTDEDANADEEDEDAHEDTDTETKAESEGESTDETVSDPSTEVESESTVEGHGNPDGDDQGSEPTVDDPDDEPADDESDDEPADDESDGEEAPVDHSKMMTGDPPEADVDLAPQADLMEGWAGVDEPGSETGDGDATDGDTDEGAIDGDDGGTVGEDDEGTMVGEEYDGAGEPEADDAEPGAESADDGSASESSDAGLAVEEPIEDELEEDEADEEDEEDESYDPVEMHDDATPIQRKTGPEYDQEQPLADHIEEMIKRLAVVVVIAGLVSLLAFPFGEDFITFLWYSVLPADVSQPHVYHPLELIVTQFKAASLLGVVIALPVFVYETYLFMRPGLYPHERRYYLAAVPTSLILAFVGLLFGYFLVLPAVMTYFLYYSRDVVDIAFALGQTFGLMLVLLGYLALVFQIPLFIMLAIMMGLTSRQWLEDRRLIFWGAFLGISFLFSPDPTGMAPILVAATMIALFEGTLLLLRWTNRG